LYRVHEFTKVEMFAWTKPDMDASHELFDEMLAIQTEILESLDLHCRVLEMPATDLGKFIRDFELTVTDYYIQEHLHPAKMILKHTSHLGVRSMMVGAKSHQSVHAQTIKLEDWPRGWI